MATWESRETIYTYCGLCGHTPTRVCQMGSATWAILMRWYDMVSSRHTYSGPCGHTGVCSPPLYKMQPMWSSHFDVNFITVVAHVAMQETRAVPYTNCSPGSHTRCSCKYQCLLLPMWPPESLVKIVILIMAYVTTLPRQSATWAWPHGPFECDGIIWYLIVTQCGSYGHIRVCSFPLYTSQTMWSSQIGWPHGPQ